ncbi:MAG: MerR family DNA-binding transcriptional regulator [Oscillospiraceae bacterium]|nr:MerR family DNA-binding transcriptional regulator [Oscillospiraceae bacterium]
MTIKEFTRLCGCNPQTLRYYDHVNLLKPVKVSRVMETLCGTSFSKSAVSDVCKDKP